MGDVGNWRSDGRRRRALVWAAGIVIPIAAGLWLLAFKRGLAGHELLHAALSGRSEPILAELSRHPQDAALWELLGEAHANVGRYDEAVTAYRRAITIEPESLEALWMLGITQACREDTRGVDEVQTALARIDTEAAAQYRDLAPKGCCAFGGCAGSPKSKPDNKQMQRTRHG